MIKRLIVWLLMMATAAALAEGAQDSDALKYAMTQDGIVIHYLTGEHEEFVIPEHIGGVPVVGIADYSFAEHPELKRLTIPATVAEISGRAFLNTAGVILVVEPGSEAEDFAIVYDYKYTYADRPDQPPLKDVAAGEGFSVGLHTDGTVSTAGRASELSGWTDIVDVAAGSCILGVRADGSVLLSDGRVFDWTEVAEIDACGENIVALRRDGTVYSTLGLGVGWTNIVQVAASADGIVGLSRDGSVLTDGALSGAADWPNVRRIAAGDRHFAGLCVDTTVAADGDNAFGQCDTQGWIDIVDLVARHDRTAAVRFDGVVLFAGVPAEWMTEASQWRSVTAAAMSGSHIVALKSDGSAVAAGDDGDGTGMLNVGGWYVPADAAETPAPETVKSTMMPTLEPTGVPTVEPTLEPTPAPTVSAAAPEPRLASGGSQYVAALKNLKIRDGAGTEFKQIGRMEEGERAAKLLLEKEDSEGVLWYNVLCGNVAGWVRSDLVWIESETSPQPTLQPQAEQNMAHGH